MTIDTVIRTDDHPAQVTSLGGQPGDHDEPGMRTTGGDEFNGKAAWGISSSVAGRGTMRL